MHNDFVRGRIVQQASQVLALYAALPSAPDVVLPLFNTASIEMYRLCDNEIQVCNTWGDAVQLAGLIVLLVDDYRSTALDSHKENPTCR